MRNASIANSSGPPVVFGSCVSPDSGVLGILFIRLSLTRLSTNGGAVTMGSPLGFRCAERRTGYSKQRGKTAEFSSIVGGLSSGSLQKKDSLREVTEVAGRGVMLLTFQT